MIALKRSVNGILHGRAPQQHQYILKSCFISINYKKFTFLSTSMTLMSTNPHITRLWLEWALKEMLYWIDIRKIPFLILSAMNVSQNLLKPYSKKNILITIILRNATINFTALLFVSTIYFYISSTVSYFIWFLNSS